MLETLTPNYMDKKKDVNKSSTCLRQIHNSSRSRESQDRYAHNTVMDWHSVSVCVCVCVCVGVCE